MLPAKRPKDQASEKHLLILDGNQGTIQSRLFEDLPKTLSSGDLLVVNDAATFPASLTGITRAGERVEVRLLPKNPAEAFWQGVIFGAGSWRIKTELRALPPKLEVGEEIRFTELLRAKVTWSSPESYRWIRLEFSLPEEDLWREIYQAGRPVQYSYLEKDFELWSFQTCYSSLPWASEMPSAGRPLTWELILELQRKGIETVSLTHATGLSSTGDVELDALLPFPEFFQLPQGTVDAIERTLKRKGRVIAVGTSVVRALEGQALNHQGKLVSGYGQTQLLIGKDSQLKIVSGILTGVHEIGESHYRLLEAFTESHWLKECLAVAESNQNHVHEFGDSFLVMRKTFRL